MVTSTALRILARLCVCSALSSELGGCALIEDLGDVTLAPSDGGAGASGGGAVAIEVPGSGYAIDATEVTNAAYLAWLATKPDPGSQAAACGWNKTFAPAASGNGCDQLDPAKLPERPVGCVNWCQAYAYCAGTGGHLCGRIGGGDVAAGEENDPAANEWFRACTRAGERIYPYGDDFNGALCNTFGNHGVTVDVGHYPSCRGGFDGIVDMSGNTEEWEDSCTVGSNPSDAAADACTSRGGAYWSKDTEARCDSNRFPPRNFQTPDLGLRCRH